MALGEISEARKVFEQYANVLAQLAAESDTAGETRDHMDRRPVEGAINGLARCKAEIAKLERS